MAKLPRILDGVRGPATGRPDYALGPDSLPQEAVPQGSLTKRTWRQSGIYPDAEHDYWVYVPAQYDAAEPACVMAFQDGYAYAALDGPVRALTVFDNLIHSRQMPVTIGVFVDPGRKAEPYDQRAAQYVPLTGAYARFLLEELLPEVGKDYQLTADAAGRAICGMSDGGVCAFTAAWQRPDAFSKVVSHIGSYTRLRGGSEYPFLIRNTRGKPKPIRVFLQDGEDDLNIAEGSWTLANQSMASALQYARYDHRFELGAGGHDLGHGGAIFPATLRWLWRGYPGVRGEAGPGAEAVLGEWDVETRAHSEVRRSVLKLAAQEGGLAATLEDEREGALEVKAVKFDDGILHYAYDPPPSQLIWGKGSAGPVTAWLRLAEEGRLEGALSAGSDPVFDYATTATRHHRG